MKKADYPHFWPALSRMIRRRAGNQCECEGECGLHPNKRCEELNYQPAKWANGKIVLTVAHLDHDTWNSRLSNLKAMCNRCHLRYDCALHVAHARAKRRSKRAVGDLFQL